MALTKGEKVALWIGGGVVTTSLLYYLGAGLGRDRNAALIPDAIEDRLDMVVEAMNTRFGREWVNRGLAVLKQALEETLPGPLVALVDVVVAAERAGHHHGWNGARKRIHAVQLASA